MEDFKRKVATHGKMWWACVRVMGAVGKEQALEEQDYVVWGAEHGRE